MEETEVPTEHLHEEIQHQAERGRERWALGVALSSALLAGFAAVSSLMAGHHATTIFLVGQYGRWRDRHCLSDPIVGDGRQPIVPL